MNWEEFGDLIGKYQYAYVLARRWKIVMAEAIKTGELDEIENPVSPRLEEIEEKIRKILKKADTENRYLKLLRSYAIGSGIIEVEKKLDEPKIPLEKREIKINKLDIDISALIESHKYHCWEARQNRPLSYRAYIVVLIGIKNKEILNILKHYNLIPYTKKYKDRVEYSKANLNNFSYDEDLKRLYDYAKSIGII